MSLSDFQGLVENSDARKIRRYSRFADKVVGNIIYNKEYYKDQIKFNFSPVVKGEKKTYLNAGALPKEIQTTINRLYEKYKDIDCVFVSLNVPKSEFCRWTPLEAKYVFEYKRKHGHLLPGEDLTEEEILRPLDSNDHDLFIKMF